MPGGTFWLSSGSTASLVVHFGRAALVGVLTWETAWRCRWTAGRGRLQTDVVPVTRYAKSGEVSIAYQAFGDGPVDLVFVPGFISHIELAWEEPYLARFLRRLAAFTRVIFFDKRGTGLSDPVAHPPGLVERMDDIRAVMDAAGSERAALFGVSDGGCLCIAFAAAHPGAVGCAGHLRILRPSAAQRRLPLGLVC